MRAVIIGGASCVWGDLARAEELGDFDALIAINDAGAECPYVIDYWITLHHELLDDWVKRRAENGFAPARAYIAHENNTQSEKKRGKFPVTMLVPYTWPGSSGLFAVEAAVKNLGLEKGVLCGVPMTKTPHFAGALQHTDRNKNWEGADGFWEAWPAAYPHIKDKVRSMSGRTMELLGEPTRQWLAE